MPSGLQELRRGSREADHALANFAADVRAGQAKPIRVQKAEAKAEVQLRDTPSERTLGQLLDEWLAHRQSLGLSPTTLRGYQRMAKRIQADPVASTALSALEHFDLDALYGRLTAEGKGPRTVKHHHGVVSSALGRPASGAGCARTWPSWRARRRSPNQTYSHRLSNTWVLSWLPSLDALLIWVRSPCSRSLLVAGGASCAGCARKTSTGRLTA